MVSLACFCRVPLLRARLSYIVQLLSAAVDCAGEIISCRRNPRAISREEDGWVGEMGGGGSHCGKNKLCFGGEVLPVT
ncbi:MAG: hypothetical protein JOS17DRAFT_745721 [Linnemannia elongata]|nr:MAG: hypothetical protein JOS17DRAFT_745721 [Linnemannia elongata]